MCGINGIINFDDELRSDISKKLQVMLNSTQHRGPDQQDTYISKHAALGLNRLSIIAPSERALIQKDHGLFALFNGEIVNYKNLRSKLHHIPEGQSDTSIILPLLRQIGPDFVKSLAGMFALAIYDRTSNTLQLWRDQLGIKPLYYYHKNNTVLFSSEIKAIYAVMDPKPSLDFSAIDHTLRYRFHPGELTIFPDIKRVLPGETIIFAKNRVQRKQYWVLSDNVSIDHNETHKNNIYSFQTLLIDVVKENVLGDVPGGFFVSGGIDSSLVTSIALSLDSRYTRPISLRFSPKSVPDETYAQHLERHVKRKFEWVEITDEIARHTLEELVKYIDEPLENPIHVGTYLMAKRAREMGIKSVLTGDGSDEFFLGYERHKCWFKDKSNACKIYPKWLWTFTPEELDELYTDEAKTCMKPLIDIQKKHIEPFDSVEKILRFERADRLPEYHCMRLDRMTMANGVEAKVPFLDYRLVEFALNMSLNTLYGISGKEFLQEVAKPWLPPEIIKREKVHFPSLPDQWVSGKGVDWVSGILLDSRAKTTLWFKREIIERYIQEHKNGITKRGRKLWACTALELWLKNISKT